MMKNRNNVIICSFVLITLITQTFASSGGLSLVETLPSTPDLQWIIFAILIVSTIMIIAGIIYAVSGVVDSPGARAWARTQVYEGVVSLALLVLFIAFAFLLFGDPSTFFTSLGSLSPSSPCYGAATTIFDLSTCDLATFNGASFNLMQAFFYVTMIFGFNTGISVSFSPTQTTRLTNVDAGANLNLQSILPVGTEQVTSFGFNAMLFMLLLNQLQLLLLSGSVLFLGFFVSLGLILRSFGLTRSFGGTLIALGLGLGVVYPMIVAITYGYIDVQIGPTNVVAFAGSFLDFILGFIGVITGFTGLPSGQWVYQMIYIFAGLTFIPFLNFAILDAFIVDFSKAIGEKINFMSLLTGLV